MSEAVTLETPFPFGKHKGKPLGVVMNDSAYIDWCLSQVFFVERYAEFAEVVRNGGPARQECTPEHNAMQLRLLDEATRTALAKCCEFEDGCVVGVGEPAFEAYYWDAVFRAVIEFLDDDGEMRQQKCDILVECKPLLGDDYPSVMRTLQNRTVGEEWVRGSETRRIPHSSGDGPARRVILLCDRFESKAATLEQAKKFFASGAVHLVLWSELS